MRKRFERSFRPCSSQKGYHCTAVQNGRVAQEHVKKVTPDLCLERHDHAGDGWDRLLNGCGQYDPEVPVIMVTAIHDISTALEAIRRGAYDYILKPFEKDQLFWELEGAAAPPADHRKNRNYQRNWSSSSSCAPRNSPQSTWNRTVLRRYARSPRSALDLKDAETEGHCQRVTAFASPSPETMPVPESIFAHSGACRFPP